VLMRGCAHGVNGAMADLQDLRVHFHGQRGILSDVNPGECIECPASSIDKPPVRAAEWWYNGHVPWNRDGRVDLTV
jgi:hypothetical protein